MQPISTYDPEIAPDPKSWLELDEQERIDLAEAFHRREKIKLPNLKLHAVFHTIVENQIAMAVAPVVRAIPRLMKQGLSRHDAIHAVASVLAEHMNEQTSAKGNDSAAVSNTRCEASIDKLNAKSWLAMYEPPGGPPSPRG